MGIGTLFFFWRFAIVAAADGWGEFPLARKNPTCQKCAGQKPFRRGAQFWQVGMASGNSHNLPLAGYDAGAAGVGIVGARAPNARRPLGPTIFNSFE